MNTQVIGLTNALTDILVPVTDEQLSEMNLYKKANIAIRKVNSSKLHEIVYESNVKRFLGGSPTNTIRSMNNLGLKCSLIGSVGDDYYGKYFVDQLHKEGIKPYLSKRLGRKSGKCFVFITPDGERSFVLDKSICGNFPNIDVEKIPKQDWFYTSGYELIENSEKALNFAKTFKKIGTKISFDLAAESEVGDYQDRFKEMISYSDILFVSQKEMDLLGLEKEANNTIIVLKKGEKGSTIYHNKEAIEIPAVKVNSLVNTNGAGDSYAAGFLAEYIRRHNLGSCGEFASTIASKVCSQEESWYQRN